VKEDHRDQESQYVEVGFSSTKTGCIRNGHRNRLLIEFRMMAKNRKKGMNQFVYDC